MVEWVYTETEFMLGHLDNGATVWCNGMSRVWNDSNMAPWRPTTEEHINIQILIILPWATWQLQTSECTILTKAFMVFPSIPVLCYCKYFMILISETTPSKLPLIWIWKKMSVTGSRTYWVWVTDGHLLRKAHFGGIGSQASFLGCTYEGRFRWLRKQNREKKEEEKVWMTSFHVIIKIFLRNLENWLEVFLVLICYILYIQ